MPALVCIIVILALLQVGGSQNKESVAIEEKLRRNCYDIPAKDLDWSTASSNVLGKGLLLPCIVVILVRSVRNRQKRIVVEDNRSCHQSLDQSARAHRC